MEGEGKSGPSGNQRAQTRLMVPVDPRNDSQDLSNSKDTAYGQAPRPLLGRGPELEG